MIYSRIFFSVLLCYTAGISQDYPSWTSGGELSALQAAYDVSAYGIHLKIDPAARYLSGYVDIILQPVSPPLKEIELDLIKTYTVQSVAINGHPTGYVRNQDKIFIMVPPDIPDATVLTMRVDYEGKPPEAKNPPWDGGFIWSEDQNGTPWVGVSCQGEGAKIWWPCKDHPSDEPDSVNLFFTIPAALTCASNGILVGVRPAEQGWKTWHWKTRYPINNYSITVNIADYVVHQRRYPGKHDMDMVFYVLREDEPGADALLLEAENMLSFFSRHFGEYPWIKEKFGLAQSSYYGMEHQTINSYGNHYRKTDKGYDFLLFHEMAHEWWGNYLTAADWADFWLHEGTAIYAEALYVEDLFGPQAYFDFFRNQRSKIQNIQPIIPKRNATTNEVYSNDIYYKGASLLHMLRFIIGKTALDSLLYRTVQEDKGRPYNQILADDFIALAQGYSSYDLTPFFQRYLYRSEIPVLKVEKKRSFFKMSLTLKWIGGNLSLPVEIGIGKEDEPDYRIISVSNAGTTVTFSGWPRITIDPHGWLLADIR